MSKSSEDRRIHLRDKLDHSPQSQNRSSKCTIALPPKCQPSATSPTPALKARILRANRPRRTPSDAMRQQPDNVDYYFHSRPRREPAAGGHLRHRRYRAATNHRHHLHYLNLCVDRSDQLRQPLGITHTPTCARGDESHLISPPLYTNAHNSADCVD
ncbi:hypothetical protein SprV_0702409500 [Sparganum proliferum]